MKGLEELAMQILKGGNYELSRVMFKGLSSRNTDKSPKYI